MIYELLLMIYVLGTLVGLGLVFRKASVAVWKAFVPLWNVWLWVRLCGKRWFWFVGMLIPGLNIFQFCLLVCETARVFRRYGFWEQLVGVLLPCFYLPWLGLLPEEKPRVTEASAAGDSNGQVGASSSAAGGAKLGFVLPKRCGERWVASYHDPRVEPPMRVSDGRDWTEAFIYALIAAVLIRAFVFELFSIPSSSMEKSLLVGDHLLVSKMAYGPRVIQTPLALPLMHNTIVGTHAKSYIDNPRLPYYRFPGYTHVKRFDAVVFNFPAGDTVLLAYPGGEVTYYDAVRQCGREAVLDGSAVLYGQRLGGIVVRPVDKREHYIKRCVGLPGEDLEVKDQVVHINGKPVETPEQAQFHHMVVFAGGVNPTPHLDACGVSQEDMERLFVQHDIAGNTVLMGLPLTSDAVKELQKRSSVLSVERMHYTDYDSTYNLFPSDPRYRWSLDSFGPIHIPAKGEELHLTLDNLPLYRRVITAYEGNTLEVRDGVIYINGNATDRYTVQQNYYWMMGDNRHGSQDSRFWGFVPEDHIAGKAKWVLWNRDKDHGGLRWNRTLRNANKR